MKKNKLIKKILIIGVSIIAGTYLLIIGGYILTLFVVHDFDRDFMKIDSCLDSGGVWNYDERVCSK